ncbi:hypothetical protein MBAV_000200 [Candidatus Magnetobacterium bavaricum]|uniref:Uncharacterized protein n=1 Tax=Candidatus Magnetobacterium bavaricum TaxID=29290 RepID=A0A0F3H0E3_9BACT|nr:hypothetical protein MBAV_000200 [Candidatus Magnetobacterium bavaricum]
MKDELYIDIVSKTIISKLSDEIVSGIAGQASDLIRELLRNEVSTLLRNSNDELKRYIDDSIESHLRTQQQHREPQIDAEEIKHIRAEISSIEETLRTIYKTHSALEKTMMQVLNTLFEVKTYVETKTKSGSKIDNEQMDLLRRFLGVARSELAETLTIGMDDRLTRMETTIRSLMMSIWHEAKTYIGDRGNLQPGTNREPIDLLSMFVVIVKDELTETLTARMDDRLARMEKTTRSLILDYTNDIRKYIAENIEKYVNIKTIAQIWRKERSQGA